MAVLVIVGLMNLAWMAIIAVVFVAEKNWRRGVTAARFAGAAVIILGIAVVAFPELLVWLSGGTPPAAMGGHM
jgi:predicted metal-binding membrane protein